MCGKSERRLHDEVEYKLGYIFDSFIYDKTIDESLLIDHEYIYIERQWRI